MEDESHPVTPKEAAIGVMWFMLFLLAVIFLIGMTIRVSVWMIPDA